jgi:hypothetical protein
MSLDSVLRSIAAQDSAIYRIADINSCFERDSNLRSQGHTLSRPRGHWDQTFVRVKSKLKVNLSLCFNRELRHEGVLGEWRYIPTHS